MFIGKAGICYGRFTVGTFAFVCDKIRDKF